MTDNNNNNAKASVDDRLMFDNRIEHVVTLLTDIVCFMLNAIYFVCETIWLTILPARFRKLKDVSGQVVLITGGGGGVGAGVARNFAQLNARVVIWDINKDAIQHTIDELSALGLKCAASYAVDISDREAVYAAARLVRQDIGPVDILVNNAGVVACKTFWELPDKCIDRTYAVNILSHYWTVRAVLPEMMRRNSGHIVTVASVTGLLGTYGCTDYAATKFACVGFHESLHAELRTHGFDGVHMTLVCPSYIASGMFSGVRPRLFPMLTPQFVADAMCASIRRNEYQCILPDGIRVMMMLKYLVPAKVGWDMMSRVIRGPQSMMTFKGRGRVAAG